MKRLFICIAATLIVFAATAADLSSSKTNTTEQRNTPAEQTDYDTTETTTSQSYGAVKVKSYPSRANVYIDGVCIGRTPITYQLPVGEHKIDIDKANWGDTYTPKSITIKEFETVEEKASFKYDEDRECYFAGATMTYFPSKYTISVSHPFFWSIAWDAYIGVDIHKKHFIGLGVGFVIQPNKPQYANGLYYLKRPTCCFSLSSLVRTEFLNNDTWSPYLGISVGGYLALKSKWGYNASSLVINPHIGFRIGEVFTAALGYQYNTAPVSLQDPYDFNGDFIRHTNVGHTGIHSISLYLSCYFGGYLY